MNFEKMFKDYDVPYSLKVNRGWVNVNCPWCDTKIDSFNLGFNPVGDYCTCWKCGNHSIKHALSQVLYIPLKDVPQLMEQYEGHNDILMSLNKRTAQAVKLTLPTDTFTKQERIYLKNRGFNPVYLHNKYKLVGGGITGNWKYRIIIPLIYNNKIVSWTGRSILSKEKIKEYNVARYRNLSIEESVINCKEIFYNMDNVIGKKVVLTEGPMDVLRFDGNAICSFGTSLTQQQIKLLTTRYKKVFILFDNEVEAQKKAKKYGTLLSVIGVDVEVVDAFSDFGKKDMGECTVDEINFIKQELNV